MEKEKKQIIKEQDIIELLARIYSRKRFIICFTLISFVIGIILAFTSVKQYTAQVMVSPESAESSGLSGNINSLASMVGLDFSTSSEAIYQITWGQYQNGELLNSWPRDEKGDPVEPAYLCLRSCNDLADQLTVNMLKAYGIPCLCMERAEGSLGRVVLGISGYGVEIYVPATLLDDAKLLIEEEHNEEL